MHSTAVADSVEPRNDPNSTTRRRSRSLDLDHVDIGLYTPGSERRRAVEQYIQHTFRKTYDAQVSEFMPWLMTTECPGGQTAAVGIRAAAADTLFLEQYLDQAIETELADQLEIPAPGRHKIAEIGNLVASRSGASHLLFLVFTATLYQAGFRWIVFTATAQVQKSIQRLHFHPHRICAANPERIEPHLRQQWGHYYDGAPSVMAGNLTTAMQQAGANRFIQSILARYKDRISDYAQRLSA